jgi:drug/metabolite transporter (DMT)-like permease
VMLLPVAAVTGELNDFHPAAVSLESWLGLAYLIVAGSIVAYSSYTWLLREVPISIAGTYAYVNPVVAVLLGTLVLGEPLAWPTLAGGGIILASVALIVSAPRRRAVAEPRPAAVAARAR